MARFDDRATRPARGPGDMLRWKVWEKVAGPKEPRPPTHAELDALRPGLKRGGAEALRAGGPTAVWIGHATWAVRLAGLLIATDPIWSRAIQGVVPRLVPPGVAFSDVPKLDVVLVTHDHMDHMDFATLKRIGPAATYVVPLGNGGRLRKIGLSRVVELDWWQAHGIGKLEITLVPSRHWSMRMPWTRNETLWGGFVLRAPQGVLYHAGDTAYGEHFGEIGRRVGAIDWAMLPIGAYAPRWFMRPQHMGPEEAGEGFLALGARKFFAMHWGTFKLTDEPVGEPPALLRAGWRSRGLDEGRLWIADVGEARPLEA
jgi:L-ascorbate metabolism protein UlaG (beta-lactamase superfamily)